MELTKQILSGIRVINYTRKVVEVKLNDSAICLAMLHIAGAVPSHRRDLPDVPTMAEIYFYNSLFAEGAISVEAATTWSLDRGWVLVAVGDGPLPEKEA